MRHQPRHARTTEQHDDGGVVLLTLMTTLVPLLVIVGAFTAVLTSHAREQRVVLDQERALMAAESGIDEAIYRGQIGTLTNGLQAKRRLSGGLAFTFTATHLGADGTDNDSDTVVDEDDEDVYQVVCEGFYRNTSRRVAAYLGPVPLLPVSSLTGAIGAYNPSVNIDLRGSSMVSGNDRRLDGTLTGASQHGMSIASPGTVADLSSTITGSEKNRVVGTGSNPSLTTSPALDLTTIVNQIKNTANIVLTANSYSGASLGDASLGITNSIYRNGNVHFTGTSRGAGIMLVTGDLRMTGAFRFDGVIIVLGDIVNSSGTAEIYGAIIQGPGGSTIEARGNLSVHYSTEGINVANSNSGTYAAFNGWQELAR